MDFSEILKSLNKASAFELFRLQAMIEQVLKNPEWNQAIQSRLEIGQEVEYFSWNDNGVRKGRVLKLGRSQVRLRDLQTNVQWRLDYAAINVDGLDVQVREEKPRGLGRNELAIGDSVGFNHEGRQMVGKIVRLNPKTVTLQCANGQWRVAYVYLQRVVDGETFERQVIEHQ